ncbi:ATP synthase subunit gamma [Operophtera brumata]|uniref:F-ATPase gamma subunit n=1 Tax=Operophtera brumata TaxID=104452 RepID=A0A0L7LUJ4_OPEBR|nr:ATP synthase subunit gamma [Operophtera brumata]
MLGRMPGVCTQVAVASNQQQRNMATLKIISLRLKSVKNIQKITQSMKMVSAAKYARAERDLKAARPVGEGAVQFYERAEIGRLPPTFLDAAKLASNILTCGYEFASGKIIYNKFRSVVSYQQSNLPLFSRKTIENAPKLAIYDSLDSDVLQSYTEFSLASMIFFAMKEGACSEQSARMSAMDNATKNAGEMIDKLTLTFNRTRQAVITRELIEIISGAAALE